MDPALVKTRPDFFVGIGVVGRGYVMGGGRSNEEGLARKVSLIT